MIGKYLAIDVETTGLESGVHEIVQIGAVMFEVNSVNGKFESKVVDSFNSKVRPQFYNNVQEKAMIMNGLSKRELMEAPLPHIVKSDFKEWWEEVLRGETLILLGQNIGGFDKGFLQIFFGTWFSEMFDYHSFDTWTLAKTCQDLGLIPNDLHLSLSDLGEFFDVERIAHSALPDALVAMDLQIKMYNLLLTKGL